MDVPAVGYWGDRWDQISQITDRWAKANGYQLSHGRGDLEYYKGGVMRLKRMIYLQKGRDSQGRERVTFHGVVTNGMVTSQVDTQRWIHPAQRGAVSEVRRDRQDLLQTIVSEIPQAGITSEKITGPRSANMLVMFVALIVGIIAFIIFFLLGLSLAT